MKLGFTVAEGRLTGIIVDLAVLTSSKAVLESYMHNNIFLSHELVT